MPNRVTARRTAFAAAPALAALLLVAGTGCVRKEAGEKPRFPDAARAAREAEDPLANAERITPLPRVAEERPAPKQGVSLDQAETAVADKPEDAARVLTLAYVYYAAKAYNDAAKTFEKAAKLRPDDPKPLLYLGYTQMAVGALEPALATFERVIALKDVPRETKSEAYLQIGNARGARGEDEKAIQAFTQSLANDPKQGLASLALGGWAARNRRWDQARDFLTDATRDLPDGRHRAQAYAALGKVAEAEKDAKAAIAYYKKSLEIDPENAWAGEGAERLKKSAGGKPAA
jgi:tetratricopeptide (TPR) repeat protein